MLIEEPHASEASENEDNGSGLVSGIWPAKIPATYVGTFRLGWIIMSANKKRALRRSEGPFSRWLLSLTVTLPMLVAFPSAVIPLHFIFHLVLVVVQIGLVRFQL